MKERLKRLLWIVLILFIVMNIISYMHAYKFTHFTDSATEVTKDPVKLSTNEKILAILTGVNNPRPFNRETPSWPYSTLSLQSNKKIECWYIPIDSSKGTVAIFHGYRGCKSSMLDQATIFRKLGYNILMVDFMGSGGSEGNQITIGFKEATQVKTCYDYLDSIGEKKIFLYGTSLGAVAILKCFKDYKIKPRGIIIECPFGSMYQTTCARFKIMKVPPFPMAGLLVFWGGVQNGFWAFGHRPIEYAKSVNCPTLLLYGEQDQKVSRKEIDDIFANLGGQKALKTYRLAGHENYLEKCEVKWTTDITDFIRSIPLHNQ